MPRMRTIRIDRRRVTQRALQDAVRVLHAGGVVAFPTETAYGLAADPTRPSAVRAIYVIKGRARSKGLPLIAGSVAQARSVVSIPRALKAATAQHWPGPFTVVAKLWPSARAKYRHVSEQGTMAIRVSASAWARALAKELGCPITATSANLAGAGECYTGAAVRKAFFGRGKARTPDLLLDAGSIPKRPPSTIVTVENGKLRVLRQGKIKLSK